MSTSVTVMLCCGKITGIKANEAVGHCCISKILPMFFIHNITPLLDLYKEALMSISYQ